MTGNPSISETVATYMTSLRTRKVHARETPTSACAITSDILEQLFDFNHLPENWNIKDYNPRSRLQKENLHQWGGPLARHALSAIYAITFLCLLRSDEVLKIRREYIEFNKNGVTLTLPFRKTHKDGGIQPFPIQALPEEEAHLCPVRALGEWMNASKIMTGYMFRKIVSGDWPSSQDIPMTSEQFLEMFRNNLLDLDIDPYPYGTHSFRRGGCQYLASQRRWTIRQICSWGGWSLEFSNLTIVRYLISWNDNPTERREDLFNPTRPPALKCYHCGRSCHCA
ncbi:unnamed protein product [Cyclocybe aegerita]|uniref:DNA breaking-rejoining enzyme n=1 Tax=Cyclocybe aegerita TaxID=1973307 RepID=A0A8S0WSL1_CYCAE|nr:unnamed protein product [Cyclocybe aegerita]